jgi:malate synthase
LENEVVELKSKSGTAITVQDLLYQFVKDEVVPGSKWSADDIFTLLADLTEGFGPQNQKLLGKRLDFQTKIDTYYQRKRESGWVPTTHTLEADAQDLEGFLLDIDYLKPETAINFQVDTPELDTEMEQNGPELVTPVTNASMAIGGANARWVSLYDAYFLSDIHPEIDQETQRSDRLKMVVNETNSFLDEHVASWTDGLTFSDIQSYSVSKDTRGIYQLQGYTLEGKLTFLQESSKFVAFNLDSQDALSEFFLVNNGLHLQFQLYPEGAVDPTNGQFKDLITESAITNIIDFEDSVSVIDVEDYIIGIRNFLGLIKGDLTGYGSRGNLKTISSDKTALDPQGITKSFKGTSLMSVRNVSLHMYTDMVKVNNREIPERLLGVLLTTLITSLHDKGSTERGPNSKKGYVYQVTPKLQSSEEVAEQMRFFKELEKGLGISTGSILIGIMNEEFGMTLQLGEALKAAQGRAFFINTGFLDRTGSQIRAQMHAGPVNLRDDLTRETYNTSYELHNVDIGIQTGIHKHGKIGKGMQVRNRAMAEMMQTKINHPRTGGNTAWVPAPNPSALHSMHYHMIDVGLVQRIMEDSPASNIPRKSLLTFPLLNKETIGDKAFRDNLILRYVHSMFAYAEPWVNRGIGCSGVNNFDGIEEMKDRATERIDGAILANWKLHGVISQSDIEAAVQRAVVLLDQQNANVEGIEPIGGENVRPEEILKHPTVASVLEVIEDSSSSPSGYVEPALFTNRRLIKSGN